MARHGFQIAPEWFPSPFKMAPQSILEVLEKLLELSWQPGGLMEATWEPLGALLGAFWTALGSHWRSVESLERSWSSPESLLDPLGDVLRALGDPSATSQALLEPT